ncbi:nitrite reductase small subunit NirD [Xanthomonas sp. NCPPB 1128]|uniref:nitrite reductase small subunit NirD n=1 Tax=Xanthomonas sp. NCPPB 1128 TaxID=1775876 RepID=UPI0009E29D5B|nr:nitrite reductase small subunit NirD [Xanthomonas sp. NCPPB 1128]
MATVSDPIPSTTATDRSDDVHQWLRICRLDEIPMLGARVLHLPGVEPIALFRSEGERVFALVDRCPHKGGPLSQGLVAGDSVTCPLHAWQIDLASGQACAPDVGCARRFPVRVQDGEVWLSLQDAG